MQKDDHLRQLCSCYGGALACESNCRCAASAAASIPKFVARYRNWQSITRKLAVEFSTTQRCDVRRAGYSTGSNWRSRREGHEISDRSRGAFISDDALAVVHDRMRSAALHPRLRGKHGAQEMALATQRYFDDSGLRLSSCVELAEREGFEPSIHLFGRMLP